MMGRELFWLTMDAHWLGPWACPVDTLHMHLLGEMHGYFSLNINLYMMDFTTNNNLTIPNR